MAYDDEHIDKTMRFLFADEAEMEEARIQMPMRERIRRLRSGYTYWNNRTTLMERDIIKYFFGIGTSEMTLEEIGEKFDLTRERVRQIKEKAIRRLRHSSRS